uniref:Histocompatibility minor 13 n=1 Tax=Oryctolagus cuniculus TaxID=9986 RepID=A0A5F9CD49_RABIT
MGSSGHPRTHEAPFPTSTKSLSNPPPCPPPPLEGERAGTRERARVRACVGALVRGARRRGRHVTSCFFRGTWLSPQRPCLPLRWCCSGWSWSRIPSAASPWTRPSATRITAAPRLAAQPTARRGRLPRPRASHWPTAASCSWRCCPSSSAPCARCAAPAARTPRTCLKPSPAETLPASPSLPAAPSWGSTSFSSPFMNKFFPANFPNRQYQLLFTQGSGENKEEIINYEFDTKDLVCLGLSSIVGVWYLLRKHWIANNLFGLAFSLNGVELLHLNNVSTGCILLGGLFIYDVFWVFGTNVMVTVAKSFEAPIKLVFPQDLLEKGLEADNFAMLGLGDIVIPGIFIALLLRFDISLKKNTHTYFYTSFAAYIFGLGLTICIMHVFKHAQPALLYLVPACIGFPVLVALAKGEVTEMFSYESSAEILPHTPRLTHFPTVSGSPASLADSMQQKLAGPRRRRPQNPSAIYEESSPKDPTAVTESKEATEASASKGLEKKEK